MGGGSLLGLADLIDGVADAPHILDLAARGELRRVDLCIGDVTGRDIPGLPPCTTVANLARRQAEASAADRARGAVNLVCQTVGVLAAFAARAEGVGDVVLVGTPVAHPVFSELIRMVELLHPVRFPRAAARPVCGGHRRGTRRPFPGERIKEDVDHDHAYPRHPRLWHRGLRRIPDRHGKP